MKNTYTYVLLAFFVINSLCAGAQKLNRGIEVSDLRLTNLGKEVSLEMTLQVGDNAAAKCQSVAIVPNLENGSQTANFPYLLVNGRKAKNIFERRDKFGFTELRSNPPYKVINMGKKSVGETTVAYKAEIPAEAWIEGATLKLGIVVALCGGERIYYATETTATVSAVPANMITQTPETPITQTPENPIVTVPIEPAIPQVVEQVVEVTTEELIIEGNIYLDFEPASYYVDPSYGNNGKELAAIRRVIDQINANPKARITSLSVVGYASPEERLANNEMLAYERALLLTRYLQLHYGIPVQNTDVNSGGEDWLKLRELVVASNIAYKSEILQIIDSTIHPDAKESKLRRLAGGRPWRIMLDTMFPELRRVEYIVTYTLTE